MKKLIILFIIILGLIVPACEYGFEEEIEIGQITDYDFENDIEEFETIGEIGIYVLNNIVYVSDDDQFGKDWIQTPEEYYWNIDENGLMKGDCDDIITFFCYLADIKIHVTENYLIGIQYPAGDKHALAYINGYYYDLRASKDGNNQKSNFIISYPKLRDNIKILFAIPYYELIWMVINYHCTIGKYE